MMVVQPPAHLTSRMAGCRLPVEKKQEKIVFVKQKKRRGKKSEEILRRYHVRLTQRGLAPGLAISHSPQKEKRSRAKDVLLPRHALSRALTLNPLLCFAFLSFPFLRRRRLLSPGFYICCSGSKLWSFARGSPSDRRQKVPFPLLGPLSPSTPVLTSHCTYCWLLIASLLPPAPSIIICQR